MDPDAALLAIRELAAEIIAGDNNLDNSSDLAEHVQALDEWLSKGGFLPGAWCLRGLPQPAQVTDLPVTLTTSDTRATVKWLVREGRRGAVYWVDDGWATDDEEGGE